MNLETYKAAKRLKERKAVRKFRKLLVTVLLLMSAALGVLYVFALPKGHDPVAVEFKCEMEGSAFCTDGKTVVEPVIIDPVQK